MRSIIYSLTLGFFILVGCVNSNKIDITPHDLNPHANLYFNDAVNFLEQYFDKDSTLKAIMLIDKAIEVDSLNPDYYGTKAKLLAELGLLDSALSTQSYANSIGAINGEYLLQLGLFQAAKDLKEESLVSFKRSNDYLVKVLEAYPDSLEAFINQQAANSLYHGVDSLFMSDKRSMRARFPDRQMEIEMTRRLKPQSLIKQLKDIEMQAINDMIMEIDQELFINQDDEK